MDEELKPFFEGLEDSSEFVRGLIYDAVNNTSSLEKRIKDLESQNDYHMQKIKENNLTIKAYQEQMEKAEKFKTYRPDIYKKTVDTLLSIGHITHSDLVYQSNRCNVSVDLYKKWLYDDGVYDKLLSSD